MGGQLIWGCCLRFYLRTDEMEGFASTHGHHVIAHVISMLDAVAVRCTDNELVFIEARKQLFITYQHPCTPLPEVATPNLCKREFNEHPHLQLSPVGDVLIPIGIYTQYNLAHPIKIMNLTFPPLRKQPRRLQQHSPWPPNPPSYP